MAVPVLDTSTVRLEKRQCVAREQDRLGKGPRDRQAGCQQGREPGWDNLDCLGTGWDCVSGENRMKGRNWAGLGAEKGQVA